MGYSERSWDIIKRCPRDIPNPPIAPQQLQRIRRTMPPRTRTRQQPAVSTTANFDLATLTAAVRRPRRNASSVPSPRPRRRFIAPPAQVELTPHPRVVAPIGPHPMPNQNPVFLETNPIDSGRFRDHVDSFAPPSAQPAVPTPPKPLVRLYMF